MEMFHGRRGSDGNRQFGSSESVNAGNNDKQGLGSNKSLMGSQSTTFLLSLTGRIESAHNMPGINDIYCKYNVTCGNDWLITSGMEEGISQITVKDVNGNFIWNFPLEVAFKSSNPFGWPQIVLSVYGSDFLGNHVARGYGVTHIPLCHGSYTKTVPLFVPESSSFLQKISSWLLGRQPEFVDPKIVAQSDGRQVVRVNSGGYITVKFDVVMKDFQKLDYVTSSRVSGNIFQ